MEHRDFKLVTNYSPTGDQPEAIEQLVQGIKENKKYQVLLGATGTGKTFTVSNVIARINKPTLVLVHNKTLAGQLYSEFKELFPENRDARRLHGRFAGSVPCGDRHVHFRAGFLDGGKAHSGLPLCVDHQPHGRPSDRPSGADQQRASRERNGGR